MTHTSGFAIERGIVVTWVEGLEELVVEGEGVGAVRVSAAAYTQDRKTPNATGSPFVMKKGFPAADSGPPLLDASTSSPSLLLPIRRRFSAAKQCASAKFGANVKS